MMSIIRLTSQWFVSIAVAVPGVHVLLGNGT